MSLRLMKKTLNFLYLSFLLIAVVGCSNYKSINVENPVLKVIYEANQEVDRVEYSLGSLQELSMNPMHEDKKVKKGYSTSLVVDESGLQDFSIAIINNDVVVYAKLNNKLDMKFGKTVEVRIIDGSHGRFELDIINK